MTKTLKMYWWHLWCTVILYNHGSMSSMVTSIQRITFQPVWPLCNGGRSTQLGTQSGGHWLVITCQLWQHPFWVSAPFHPRPSQSPSIAIALTETLLKHYNASNVSSDETCCFARVYFVRGGWWRLQGCGVQVVAIRWSHNQSSRIDFGLEIRQVGRWVWRWGNGFVLIQVIFIILGSRLSTVQLYDELGLKPGLGPGLGWALS